MFTRKGMVVTSHIFIIIKNTHFYHLNWESRLTAKTSCAVCQLQYLQEIPSLWSLETLVGWVMGFWAALLFAALLLTQGEQLCTNHVPLSVDQGR